MQRANPDVRFNQQNIIQSGSISQNRRRQTKPQQFSGTKNCFQNLPSLCCFYATRRAWILQRPLTYATTRTNNFCENLSLTPGCRQAMRKMTGAVGAKTLPVARPPAPFPSTVILVCVPGSDCTAREMHSDSRSST